MDAQQEVQLLKQLQEAIEATGQLNQVLQDEQQALINQDIDTLETTIQTKSLALTRLQMIERTLTESFKSLGLNLDRTLLAQLESLAVENFELQTSARVMRESLLSCQQLTRENAALVSSGLKRVTDSLDLLHRLNNQDVASVYGPPGHMDLEKIKRSITVV